MPRRLTFIRWHLIKFAWVQVRSFITRAPHVHSEATIDAMAHLGDFSTHVLHMVVPYLYPNHVIHALHLAVPRRLHPNLPAALLLLRRVRYTRRRLDTCPRPDQAAPLLISANSPTNSPTKLADGRREFAEARGGRREGLPARPFRSPYSHVIYSSYILHLASAACTAAAIYPGGPLGIVRQGIYSA